MRRQKDSKIEFDEIFLDSRNIHNFNRDSLEGQVEYPIGKKKMIVLGTVFAIISFAFLPRIIILQIWRGEEFAFRSLNNHLRISTEDNERGMIYDRNGIPLASNKLSGNGWRRVYPEKGFLHILGFLKKENILSRGFGAGASGIEQVYDEILRGSPSQTAEEVDAEGRVLEKGILESGNAGKSIMLTISRDLQIYLMETIQKVMDERRFSGGAGVFINAENGEVLALASLPEFDPNILANKEKQNEINQLLNSPQKPFFNRAVSGLYPPGSIVKPALAAAALQEGIINPEKQILSIGFITIPNPYDPSRPNIFRDWKAHGWVDMRRAIAVSSDVYFYEIGGGYQDQKGLGSEKIKTYLRKFGFGEKSDIDLPSEKSGFLPDFMKKENGRPWTIGDTYNISIGQGDLLVTPVQMALYAATIASLGKTPQPHLAKAVVDKNNEIKEEFSYFAKQENVLSPKLIKIAQEGMYQAVEYGTARGLNNNHIKVAAKTGTAEIGNTDKVHSWSIGFFPYENPKVAFAILMESGPKSNTVGATAVAAEVINWIYYNNNDILINNNHNSHD